MSSSGLIFWLSDLFIAVSNWLNNALIWTLPDCCSTFARKRKFTLNRKKICHFLQRMGVARANVVRSKVRRQAATSAAPRIRKSEIKIKEGSQISSWNYFLIFQNHATAAKNRGSLNFFANRESEEGWRTIFGFLQRSSLASKRLARSELLENFATTCFPEFCFD